jgi:hypothetical protein
MIREFIYLANGIEKELTKKVGELINEGKSEYSDDDMITIAKKHLKKRKRQFNKLFLGDVKRVLDETGVATKDDIKELKDYIKNKAM